MDVSKSSKSAASTKYSKGEPVVRLMKVLMIGDGGVGKSSMLLRFCDNTFSESFITTIGVDFKLRTIDVLDTPVKLQIWDTSGQERFRTITSSYYRGAHAIIVVYDITNVVSWNNIRHWLQEIDRYAYEDAVKMIAGNKCDLASDRQVASDEVADFCASLNLEHLDVSAKTGHNVETFFLALTSSVLLEEQRRAKKKAPTPPQ